MGNINEKEQYAVKVTKKARYAVKGKQVYISWYADNRCDEKGNHTCRNSASFFYYHPVTGSLTYICGTHLRDLMGRGLAAVLPKFEENAVQAKGPDCSSPDCCMNGHGYMALVIDEKTNVSVDDGALEITQTVTSKKYMLACNKCGHTKEI